MADLGTRHGHCLCGACRFTVSGPTTLQAHCVCDSCRRATGAPIVSWLGYPEEVPKWQGTRAVYASSPGQSRSFCPTCGSTLSYASDAYPAQEFICAALLSTKDGITFDQTDHAHERLPWCPSRSSSG